MLEGEGGREGESEAAIDHALRISRTYVGRMYEIMSTF